MQNYIGYDLHRLRPDGTSDGSVAPCHLIRRAMGINEGKLPLDRGCDPMVVGDTYVYVISREARKRETLSNRPHRMFAICNHCKRHIPTGRFGQHLKIHYDEIHYSHVGTTYEKKHP